jgi:citrate lyase subunit beta/citryl-CoA lyase
MLTWLYVPGDRPDRFETAVASGADAVILDLEDAVHPDRKAYARDAVAEFCASQHPVPVEVRISAPADLDRLRGLSGLTAIRVPKVDGPEQLARLDTDRPLHCLLESALGVQHAFDIARAPGVASIGLGESDLRSDLRCAGDDGLAYARGRVILAARAAGLRSPAMSVYPHFRDLDGLAASCRAGRALGFRGRAAIHPAQLPVIVDAFRPAPGEVAAARSLLESLAAADAEGRSIAVLPDGRFADPAMVAAAADIVDLAGRYGSG